MNIAGVLNNLDLRLGEQYRGNCPACDGYNTFTATRTGDGVLFNCYKAGCQLSGRRSSDIRVQDIKAAQTKTTEPNFRLPKQVLLGRPELTEWINKHGYPFHNLEIYYDLKEDRVVFPVRHGGLLVDATGRTRDIYIKRRPKWKRYGTASYAYTAGTGRIAVVVEDAISAAVAGATDASCTGVALLGTSLLSSHVEQLQGYTGAIVALDPDAGKKTLQFTQELRGQLSHNRIFAARLEDDLKYRRKRDMVLIKEKIGELIEQK